MKSMKARSLESGSGFENFSSEKQKELSDRAFASGKHISQRMHTCWWCGFTGKAPNVYQYHFDKCKKRYIHMIEDMKPIEFPQMMLSFGS
jgi:hypothetical protein